MQIGVLLAPETQSLDDYIDASQAIDKLEVNSLWTWDHVRYLHGDKGQKCLEANAVIDLMLAETVNAREIGCLVYAAPSRKNIVLDCKALAERSERFTAGLGAGYCFADFAERGAWFASTVQRGLQLWDICEQVETSDTRLALGGASRNVLECAARFGDHWNAVDSERNWQRGNDLLDGYCKKVDRDPASITRSVLVHDLIAARLYAAHGCDYLIYESLPPYDLAPIRALLELR